MDSFKFDNAAPKREFVDHDFGLNEANARGGQDTAGATPQDAAMPQVHQPPPVEPDDLLFA